MTEPPTTEQLAVAIRDDLRRKRHMAETVQRPADRLAAMLRQQLPEIADGDVAAVLMRVSAFLANAYPALRREGLTDFQAAAYAFTLVGVAGEDIHSRIARRST